MLLSPLIMTETITTPPPVLVTRAIDLARDATGGDEYGQRRLAKGNLMKGAIFLVIITLLFSSGSEQNLFERTFFELLQ